ncbi:MAG: hypothetical protein U9N00_04755, partial [Candidatus Bipolaricaulota bacterium]|nr:hypothetical protein [Candidatus Bipolaricaulota bacterium]
MVNRLSPRAITLYHRRMIPLRDYRKSRTFPIVTVVLIILNLLVFSYELTKSTTETEVLDVVAWQAHGMNFADMSSSISRVRLSPRDLFTFGY